MRFVFSLVVYCAGFASAVYVIAPMPDEGRVVRSQKNSLYGTVNSRELACAMNSGLHKVADLSKDLAKQASVLIKERVQKMQARDK